MMGAVKVLRIFHRLLGPLEICFEGDVLLSIRFLGSGIEAESKDEDREEVDIINQLRNQFSQYEQRVSKDIHIEHRFDGLTAFQRDVCTSLKDIPYGETLSYSEFADKIGKPRAVRAVASALAKNPLPLIYPCHRVIRSNGDFGDYAGGRKLKARLIELEKQG